MPLYFRERPAQDIELGIWHCTEDPDALISTLILDPEERRIFSEIHNESRRKQWIGCRMALVTLLRTKRLMIRYTPSGKPRLIDPPTDISLSHCGEYAAAIISRRYQVGIDLERIRKKIERVADRFLEEDDLSTVGTEERLAKLTVCWGIKEAIYKVFGEPEIDIKRHITIGQFDYLCHGSCTLEVRVQTPHGVTHVPVTYKRIVNYILVYAWNRSIL